MEVYVLTYAMYQRAEYKVLGVYRSESEAQNEAVDHWGKRYRLDLTWYTANSGHRAAVPESNDYPDGHETHTVVYTILPFELSEKVAK